MVYDDEYFPVRIALAVTSLVAIVAICVAVAGWVRVNVLQNGFEWGFCIAGTYVGESVSELPARASFVAKKVDGYDGLWQLSEPESNSTKVRHEEGWLRATEDPNFYLLVDRGGSRVGWVAVSGLTGMFGKGHQVVVEYDSRQSRLDCASLDPSLEGEDGSIGYAGAALEELTSDEWFSNAS